MLFCFPFLKYGFSYSTILIIYQLYDKWMNFFLNKYPFNNISSISNKLFLLYLSKLIIMNIYCKNINDKTIKRKP